MRRRRMSLVSLSSRSTLRPLRSEVSAPFTSAPEDTTTLQVVKLQPRVPWKARVTTSYGKVLRRSTSSQVRA